jgi:hypothetical protein
MKRTTGSTLTAACLRLLDLCGIFAWRNNNTGVRRQAKGRYFWTFSGMKGAPDIIGIHEVDGIGGIFLGIETKAGKDRLSDAQKIFRNRCDAAGGVYLVVREIGDLTEYLTAIGAMR